MCICCSIHDHLNIICIFHLGREFPRISCQVNGDLPDNNLRNALILEQVGNGPALQTAAILPILPSFF